MDKKHLRFGAGEVRFLKTISICSVHVAKTWLTLLVGNSFGTLRQQRCHWHSPIPGKPPETTNMEASSREFIWESIIYDFDFQVRNLGISTCSCFFRFYCCMSVFQGVFTMFSPPNARSASASWENCCDPYAFGAAGNQVPHPGQLVFSRHPATENCAWMDLG